MRDSFAPFTSRLANGTGSGLFEASPCTAAGNPPSVAQHAARRAVTLSCTLGALVNRFLAAPEHELSSACRPEWGLNQDGGTVPFSKMAAGRLPSHGVCCRCEDSTIDAVQPGYLA